MILRRILIHGIPTTYIYMPMMTSLYGVSATASTPERTCDVKGGQYGDMHHGVIPCALVHTLHLTPDGAGYPRPFGSQGAVPTLNSAKGSVRVYGLKIQN